MTVSPSELFNELEDHYENIIVNMEDEFTSHEFIEKLSQAKQELYIKLLAEYKSNGHSFQTVHAQIAKRLKKREDLVKHFDTDTKSENIFGNYNSAAIWRKVK